MIYNEIYIKLSKCDPFRDMLIYSLGDEGPYESFDNVADGVKCYVQQQLFDIIFLDNCIEEIKQLDPTLECEYTLTTLPDKDYNEEWERNHKAVLVDGFCWVRAPFHPKRDDVKYDIVIEPKMSFGTAHHSTTRLMLSMLERQEVRDMSVLDMGTGTGVLAILAAKKGAGKVVAVDVDEWAFANAKENFERNKVNIEAILGDASTLGNTPQFDLVLANINRNILLRDMSNYVAVMKPNAILIVSGFYEHDISAICDKGAELGLTMLGQMIDDGWAAVKLTSQR